MWGLNCQSERASQGFFRINGGFKWQQFSHYDIIRTIFAMGLQLRFSEFKATLKGRNNLKEYSIVSQN